jgi:hypothetical protein
MRSLLALSILSALLIASGRAVSQPVRLSPLESTTRRLPQDLRIQGADRSSEAFYAAWGTYVEGEGGEARRALQLTILPIDGGDGITRAVHSAAGRPSRLVRVVADGETGEIVFWYDMRRGAPGLYARRFDVQGAPLDDERLVVPGAIVDIVAEPGAPALTIAMRADGSSVVLDALGRVIASPPDRRFLAPHTLGADSSLRTLVDGRLELRRHYADPAPTSTHAIDVASGAFPDAWTLGVDGDATALFFFVDDPVAPPTCFGEMSAGVRLMRAVVSSEGIVGAPTLVDTFYTCNGGPAAVDARVREIVRRRVGGGHELRVVLERRRRAGAEVVVILDSIAVGVGPRGEYLRRAPTSSEWNGGRTRAERLGADSISVVRILADSPRDIVAPIADAPSGRSQAAPVLVPDLAPLVAWREASGPARLFVLNRIAAMSATPIDTVAGRDEHVVRAGLPSTIESRSTTHWLGGATRPLVTMIEWEWAYTTDTRNGVTESRAAAFMASPSGWRRLFDWSHRGLRSAPGGEFEQAAVGTGLDGSIAVAVDDRTGRRVMRLDGRTGAIDSARSTSRTPIDEIQQLDRSHWALITADTMRIAEPDVVGAPIVLEPTEAFVKRWHKLENGRLLRAIIDRDGATVRVAELDALGVIRARGSIDFATPVRDLVIAAGPGATIVALVETARGIESGTFSRQLVPLGRALLVADLHDSVASVSAAVSGEDLVVAWEMHREGVSDVFGVRRPAGALSAPEDGEATTQRGIAFTLDDGALRVRFDSTNQPVRLRIVDGAGRAMHDGDWTTRPEAISVEAWPSGVYALQAISERGVIGAAVFTIVR